MAKSVRLKVDRKPSFKYNINYQIGLLPREVSVNSIILHLQKNGITRDDFYRDRRIPFGAEKSISADRLLIYSQVFECTIDELMNHQVKAKGIRQTIEEPNKPTPQSVKSKLT